MPIKDIITPGDKFGRLTILKEGDRVNGKRGVLVQCDCGKTKTVGYYLLKTGVTKSCGCIQREILINRNSSHGYSHHPLYGVWKSMKDRCFNPKATYFYLYGGRGITVCDEWKLCPDGFCEWGMVNGYILGLKLDRIDNNGNYGPHNCRFVTPAENNKNMRSNVWVTYQDKTMILKDWTRELGLDYDLIHIRMKKQGLTFEQAINKPMGIHSRKYKNTFQ